MSERYKAAMRRDQSLPKIWLISDERNDAMLEGALKRMPRGSGFIYRHYHLDDPGRFDRFQSLRRVAEARGQTIILSDSGLTAREWGAHGTYGPPRANWPRRRELIHLATVHDMRELRLANSLGSDAALISPVFPTRSHSDGHVLGAVRFLHLARHALMPVIALGGMDRHRASFLGWDRWAAIDGLSG
ncbi:thiamine phosphate synthase [Erythrobacter sp. YT30]|uniref:thiamine phosphate synthase n=1 Tax=Erythrobacter sp. YT30 TaxID=1735012 RepID=UPI00076BE785|nr:thiamine phosphate synthase [Erythrobacter sp. YT30]KWV91582.1 thiamine monophosphate synthase [Erythrobacter sp. YT30]